MVSTSTAESWLYEHFDLSQKAAVGVLLLISKASYT